jgi:hypothetical protein
VNGYAALRFFDSLAAGRRALAFFAVVFFFERLRDEVEDEDDGLPANLLRTYVYPSLARATPVRAAAPVSATVAADLSMVPNIVLSLFPLGRTVNI